MNRFITLIPIILLFACKNELKTTKDDFASFIEKVAQAKTLEAKYRYTEDNNGIKFSYDAECIGLKENQNLNYYIKQTFDDSIVCENYIITAKGKQTTLTAYPKYYPIDKLNDQDLINMDFIDYKLLHFLIEDKTIIKRQKEKNILLQINQLTVKDSAFTRTYVFNTKKDLVKIINTKLGTNKTETIDIISLKFDHNYDLDKEKWIKNKVKM